MFSDKYIVCAPIKEVIEFPKMLNLVRDILLEWLELHLPKAFFTSQNRWWKLVDGVEYSPYEYNDILIPSYKFKMRMMDNIETVTVDFIPQKYVLEEDRVNIPTYVEHDTPERNYNGTHGCLMYIHFVRSTDRGRDKSKWEYSLINYIASRLEEFKRAYWCVKFPESWCIFTRQKNNWRKIDKRTRIMNMRLAPRKTIQHWMRTDWHSLKKGTKRSTLKKRWKLRAAVAMDVMDGLRAEDYAATLYRARQQRSTDGICDNKCAENGSRCRGNVNIFRIFDIDWNNGTGQDLGWHTRCSAAMEHEITWLGLWYTDMPNLEISMFRKAVTDNKEMPKEEKMKHYKTWLKGWHRRRKEYYAEFDHHILISQATRNATWLRSSEEMKKIHESRVALQKEKRALQAQKSDVLFTDIDKLEEQNNEEI